MIFLNRFFIIESLLPSDMKTGKELYDDCLSVLLEKEKEIKVDYITVINKEQLKKVLEGIFRETEKGCIPIIHFEMHGYLSKTGDDFDFGFILESGEKVSIFELKPLLTAINIGTKNQLFISVSACFGAAFFSIALPTERSPFKAIIGPDKETRASVLLEGFFEFYKTMFIEMNGNTALGAARRVFDEKGIRLLLISSRTLFKEVFKHFEEKHAAELEFKTRQKKEEFFNKKRDYYFMYDLYPEEKQKDAMTYDDISSK